ncbi:MAG: hypothetical protein HOW97_28455 [Catenulispora sp.]|nr:hypothetical protein [Catenulispora sp.]
MRKIRKTLGIAAAAGGLSVASTLAATPAHAAGYEYWQTSYNTSVCLRPDNSNLGSEVHWYSCDGNANGWEMLYSNTNYVVRIVWMGSGANHGACLIPNWDKATSPVVVTNGNNGAVCDQSDAYWTMKAETICCLGGPFYTFTNNASGLTLDYDISTNNRGLQLWTRIQGNQNQDFTGL